MNFTSLPKLNSLMIGSAVGIAICLLIGGRLALADDQPKPPPSVNLPGHVVLRRQDRVDWSRFSAIYLEPVQYHYDSPAVSGHRLKDKDAAKLQQIAAEALQTQLGKRFRIATSPEPEALIVRPVIVGVKPCHPIVNLVSMAAIVIPVDRGGATLHIQLLDPANNAQLAEMDIRRIGPIYRGVDTLSRYAQARWALRQEANAVTSTLLSLPIKQNSPSGAASK